MKNKILIAFFMNLIFSIFEFIGGIVTGSVAILSDSLHDLGDALSIGVSSIFEKKSQKPADCVYTYGYIRYSVLSGFIMWAILLGGSLFVIVNSIKRIIEPQPLNYNGMIVFAVFGAITNLIATLVTNHGETINQRAVNFHLLEDTLGWIAVLVGAVVIRLTDWTIIDPILSIAISIVIIINAIKGLIEILNIFLEKVPENICVDEVKKELMLIDGVIDVHHIHIRSLDGNISTATMHIVTASDFASIKKEVKHELEHFGIGHSTIEIEAPDDECHSISCSLEHSHSEHHHHHHHH